MPSVCFRPIRISVIAVAPLYLKYATSALLVLHVRLTAEGVSVALRSSVDLS